MQQQQHTAATAAAGWYTRCERCGLEVSGTREPEREHATGPCPRCDCTLRIRHEGEPSVQPS